MYKYNDDVAMSEEGELFEVSGIDANDWIHESKNLEELRDRLNFLDQSDNGLDYVDTSSLPTFSDDEIEGTDGIFSWDHKNMLIPGNEWEIVPRADDD